MYLSRIRKVSKIFNNLGWITEVGVEGEINTAFEKCLELSVMLTDQQFDCFIVLLSNFEKNNIGTVIRGTQRALIDLASKLDVSIRYAVVPLLLAEDAASGKAKSASALIYPLKNTFQKSAEIENKKLFHFYQSPHSLSSDQFNPENMGLIIVDDFVGTGNSVEKFIAENEIHLPEDRSKITVLSAYSMDTGRSKIAELGLASQFDKLHARGIADNPLITDKVAAYQLIDEIEVMIKISDQYRRGYEQSEALISLDNTPNNTFPLFWASKKHDGQIWPAMFPRV